MEPQGLKHTAPRTDLMKILDQLAKKQILYIHAPAGYGKTFSTGIWLKRTRTHNVWIHLDETLSNKPADFCEIFTRSLASLQPDNDSLRSIAIHPSFAEAPDEYAMRALHAFRDDGRRYVMVLDDLHLVHNDEVLWLLHQFIRHATSNVTFFILSRNAPPDCFSDFVLKGAVSLLDAESLKFSPDEIKSFFKDCGRELTNEQANDVYASTGGWIIGVNALILARAHAFDKKLAERQLDAFLREQVWVKWDEETRNFMMDVSVASELTPELCTALTGVLYSKGVLDRLVRENAFIRVDHMDTYRFHDLFREFLLHMLLLKGASVKNKQLKKAGEWFYKQKDYYRAVEYFIKCKNFSGVTKGLKRMYDYNSPYASIENTLSIIRLSVDGSIVEKYPFLLEVQAWAAFVEGDAKGMEGYLDQYFEQFPKIVLQNPKSAGIKLLLHCMDYRESLIGFTKSLQRLPFLKSGKAETPSLSQNMPFFHRSSRDFSEYVFETEEALRILGKTIGKMIGSEYPMIQDCILAGLSYETGNVNEASEYAVSANTKLRDEFSPELKFCAMMMLANVLSVQKQQNDLKRVLDALSEMIERDKAYYLNANFEAFRYRLKLWEGDEGAAKDWLDKYGEAPYKNLTFYKLYQHFTTARAYIASGDYNTALLFLQKLLRLCESYQRPLDVVEANVLLAIAYWKKGRGFQTNAFECLNQAIRTAYPYGFTQIFANEGAELVNMLLRTRTRTIRKDYTGDVPGAFANTLYLLALSKSKYSKGLTGGRMPQNLKFTKQQMNVMRLLCEGHSYRGIAEKMGLKYTGVKSHMELICKKLDVPGSVEAVLKIKELGILEE